MKILFIYPIPSPRLQIRRYQTGIGSISAFLKMYQHKTGLYVPHSYREDVITSKMDTFKPDLVAFSLTSNQAHLAFRIVDYISSQYNIPIIVGGVHPTVAPEDCIHRKGIMGICRGEGEEAMLDLVTALEEKREYSSIKNFWFKIDGKVIRNPSRPLQNDLDKLPFPDREIFNYQKLLHDYPQVEIMAGRGCPYRCSYCVNAFLQRFSEDSAGFIRQRSVDNVLMELEEIVRNYNNIQTILFQDDIFAINRSWLEEFSQNYRKRFRIPFWCNMRVDVIDKEKLGWLREAGCIQINVGIESGNDFIRRSVLNRDLSREKIVNTCRLAKDMGFRIFTFNMVGLPYETVDTIRDTIEINREICPDYIFCSIFYPYPGTEVYELCRRNGWLSHRDVSSYFESVSVLDQPSIQAREVTFYYEIFKGLILYPRLGKIIKLAARIKVWPGYSLYRLFQDIVWSLTRAISSNFPPSLKDYIKKNISLIRRICR